MNQSIPNIKKESKKQDEAEKEVDDD